MCIDAAGGPDHGRSATGTAPAPVQKATPDAGTDGQESALSRKYTPLSTLDYGW
jgi:hypothetical protein